jgi:hypothetical protein
MYQVGNNLTELFPFNLNPESRGIRFVPKCTELIDEMKFKSLMSSAQGICLCQVSAQSVSRFLLSKIMASETSFSSAWPLSD